MIALDRFVDRNAVILIIQESDEKHADKDNCNENGWDTFVSQGSLLELQFRFAQAPITDSPGICLRGSYDVGNGHFIIVVKVVYARKTSPALQDACGLTGRLAIGFC